MSLSWPDYAAKRKDFSTQFFAAPGASTTIMVSSHIWWTEQIALSLLNMGYNVLLHFPLYFFYTDPDVTRHFDGYWDQSVALLRQTNTRLILAGNSTAMVAHPKTGELLHEAAGNPSPIPVVNWWWDELRTRHPISSHGPASTPAALLKILSNPHVLNAIWDLDVLEELQHQHALTNLFHLPLATLPDFWPHNFTPVEARPLAACFLGNCHYNTDWVDTATDPLSRWARDAVALKRASPDTPMWTCTQSAGTPPPIDAADPWAPFVRPWEAINAAYMHDTRNQMLKAVAAHLKGKFALVGKGWDQLHLHANSEHATDKSGIIYNQSKASLNLAGGAVHGGLPLRPYDITASTGLLLTHYQRELPALFDVGKECLAFRTRDQLLAHLDHILAAPQEFNAIAKAGHARTLRDHSWQNRLTRLLAQVEQRFNLPLPPAQSS